MPLSLLSLRDLLSARGIDLGTALHDREGREIPMLPVGQPIKGVL